MSKAKLILLFVLALLLLVLGYYLTQRSNKNLNTNYINEIQPTRTQTQSKANISKTEAESVVKMLPEIKPLLSKPNSSWIINAEDSQDNFWLVQVAEIVKNSDESEHTATFNWYKIDMSSGKIVSSMFPYDKSGKLIE